MPVVALPQFRFRAGGGCHPEGDFESTGLQRNIEAQGCFFFEPMMGRDYEEGVRQVSPEGLLSMFNGHHALGCIIHIPNPRHWIAIVRPEQQMSVQAAALLCDSLQTHIYTLSVDEMFDLFTRMGVRHTQYADLQLPLHVREELAAEWSAYRVTR